MFLVKAEVRSDVGPQNYQLFKSESVRVERHLGASSPGPSPDREVVLCDVDGSPRKTLMVGNGLDHYSAVYIMNENGKTVDTVYPGPAATNVPRSFVTYTGGDGVVRTHAVG
jgi:hypothetical protein